MKRKSQLLMATVFALLGHYFVLNFFTMDFTRSQVAVVEKTQIVGKGLYKRALVVFSTNENKLGKKLTKKRVISTWDKKVHELKPGKEYLINTQNNWLVSFHVSQL